MSCDLSTNQLLNLLPEDGEAYYLGKILNSDQADFYYTTLLETIPWQFDEAIMFGKRIITKRKTAWYGEKPYPYTYSKITRTALPWTEHLLALKEIIETTSGHSYNSCLMNLYPTGAEGVSWHSDDEKELKKYAAIASLTLGANRQFCFKHKKIGEKRSVLLEHGSLLVMQGETQIYWLHRLPPTKKIIDARVNLTFRTMV